MLKINYQLDSYHINTKLLQKRMLGTLCGIDNEIGFMLRSQLDPRLVIAGAELTGLHHLLGLPHPGKSAYHLGGCGIKLNEAIIRTLGETIERYAQVISGNINHKDIKFISYDQLAKADDNIIPIDSLNNFVSYQYYQPGFPFQIFNTELPISWIKLSSLLGRGYLWVPLQMVLVGYQIKRNKGEHWISSAVTTGTAAHTCQYQALVNALLELIQIDSAMGHWYTNQIALQIQLDSRVDVFKNIFSRSNKHKQHCFSFYYLKNPDLPGLSIACVYRADDKSLPAVVVGLGVSFSLDEAMYKAYLEAVGIMGLARMTIADKYQNHSNHSINPAAIYDLDTNVAYYALGNLEGFFNKKFSSREKVSAADLPADMHTDSKSSVKILLNAFAQNEKQLLFHDLTNVEAQDLGFVVPRVWSPNLLPLCLPSAPFLNHVRYLDFGGVSHDNPHPYP